MGSNINKLGPFYCQDINTTNNYSAQVIIMTPQD